MPFRMGRAGWLMWPYFAPWLGYPYPYGSPYAAPPYSYSPMTKEEELTYLQEQAKMLKQEYDRISARLKELQKAK